MHRRSARRIGAGRRITWLLAGIALSAARASGVGAAPARYTQDQVLEALRRADLRIATVAFRLASANAGLCPARQPLSGIVVHDASRYEPVLRGAARRVFGLGDRAAAEIVVPGSPAARAGIAAGDAVLSIGGIETPAVPAASGKASYALSAQVQQQLAGALGAGPARVTVRRDGLPRTVGIDPVPGCAGDVQLETGGRFNAWSDGRDVAVTSAVLDFTRSDDELAAVIAHEMAHVILGHRDLLRAAGVPRGLLGRLGGNARKVRETEVEADRWGVYLAARAGYAPGAAADFWERFGSRRGDGPFDDATHPRWRDRVAALRTVAAEVAAHAARGDGLDPRR